MKVSQYPEDKHGGYSDSVATLLQHNLIAINNLKQSLLHYSNHYWVLLLNIEGADYWAMGRGGMDCTTSFIPFPAFQCAIIIKKLEMGLRNDTYCIGRALHTKLYSML